MDFQKLNDEINSINNQIEALDEKKFKLLPLNHISTLIRVWNKYYPEDSWNVCARRTGEFYFGDNYVGFYGEFDDCDAY
jgi:hypothetical protein